MKISDNKTQATRRTWPLAGVAAAAALALAACGGGGSGTPATPTPPAPTSKWSNATAATVTVSTLSLTGTGAPLVDPIGIVADGSGGFYVTEGGGSNALKHINSAGVVTQLNAAVGDGMLNLYGGNLYVAASADTIQRCTTAGVCTVVANNGGPLEDIVFSSTGEAFISSFSNRKIYKVPASALVAATAASPVNLSTASYCYAGCGAGTPITLTATTTYPVAASNVDASLGNIVGLALDANNNLYAAGWGMHVVYKITPAGQLSVLAGSYGTPGFADGMGTAAKFDRPYDLLTDAVGNVLLTDRGNHRVRLIKPDGTVSTLSGTGTPGSTDGAGTGATHNTPVGIALGDDGNVYVADNGSSTIRKLTTP